MFEGFEFIGNDATYSEESFSDVVGTLLCDYPDASVFIQYSNTSRTTRSYKAVMSVVNDGIQCIKHLIIDTAEATFYVSPTSAKTVAGNISMKQILANHMYVHINTSFDEVEALTEECPDINKILTAAAKLIATPGTECVYYDNCKEIDYITPESLETLNMDLDGLYELRIEGTYKGRPAFVGISSDSDLYVSACNPQAESELLSSIKDACTKSKDPFTWDEDK